MVPEIRGPRTGGRRRRTPVRRARPEGEGRGDSVPAAFAPTTSGTAGGEGRGDSVPAAFPEPNSGAWIGRGSLDGRYGSQSRSVECPAICLKSASGLRSSARASIQACAMMQSTELRIVTPRCRSLRSSRAAST